MEKRDIALKQLRASAKLYHSGDYISSITLAGAAEEILGSISKIRTNINELKKEVDYLKTVYDYFSSQKPNDKNLISKINRVKNELKHNDSGVNNWVEADFENEAVLLFVKAVKNYFSAYDEMPKDKIIRNLFNHLTL